MNVRSALLAIAAPLLLAMAAAAEQGPELEILDRYLGQFDLGGEVPHCARDGGAVFPPAAADESVFLPVATNSLLRDHVEWHEENEPHGAEQRATGPEDQFGIVFFDYHRALIADYNAWREESGHAAVRPWDPGTPIPPEFIYNPDPPNTCEARRDPFEPNPLPTWATIEGGDEEDPLYGHTRLCAFADLNQFGKALTSGFHGSIHVGVGGDMVDRPLRDPLFWASHRWLMDVQDSYTEGCVLDPPLDAENASRATPMPSVLIPVWVAALLVARRRRG